MENIIEGIFNKFHSKDLTYYEIPEGETIDSCLKAKALLGLNIKYSNITTELMKRFEYEILVIKNLDFPLYFLIVADIVNYAKKDGIIVGPGRGSVGGSLIAYALGITDIDPIKYDLHFERFINPNYVSLPAISLDCCIENKAKLFEYIKKKYGNNPKDQIVKNYKKQIYFQFSYAPHSSNPCLQDQFFSLSFYGSQALTIISKTISIIKENHNKIIDTTNIPLNDTKTFETFCKGNLSNVFQMKQAEMKSLIRSIKPAFFDDLMAAIVLFSPTPITLEVDLEFTNRKNGITPYEYCIPELESILKSTYGLIFYQEQIMQIASIVAKFPLAETNYLRKALSHKNFEQIKKMEVKFIEGAKGNHIPEEKIKIIFEMITNAGVPAFNKSHAVAYALITYQSAYLKTHYPAEFKVASKI